MLDKFKKLIGVTQKPEAEAVEAAVEVVEAPTEAQAEGAVEASAEVIAQAVELNVDNSAIQAVVAEMTSKFEMTVAGLQTQLDAALASVATLSASLEQAAADKAELVANAETKKLNARKEKVVAAIGESKADALMVATGGLDDTAFEAVVSALAGSVVAEASTDMFKEIGVAATADAAKVVAGESKEMAILRAKYSQSK